MGAQQGGVRAAARLFKAGDAEVDEIHLRIGAEHDVLRLDVPVDDVLSVQRGQRLAQLPAEPHRVLPGQRRAFFHPLAQGHALDIVLIDKGRAVLPGFDGPDGGHMFGAHRPQRLKYLRLTAGHLPRHQDAPAGPLPRQKDRSPLVQRFQKDKILLLHTAHPIITSPQAARRSLHS